jgi:hypothetical protein
MALNVVGIDLSVLDMSGRAESADTWRYHMRGISTDDFNGTGRSVSGSEPVSIPWRELWDDVIRGSSEFVSPMGRVRIDVRDPALEPLAEEEGA